MPQKSIGLIEFKGLAGAIAAADAAAKAADIELAACEITTGACVMLRIEGELVAVQTALEAATVTARKLGQFLTSKVIPRPHEGLAPLLSARGYHNHITRHSAQRPAAPKPAPPAKPAATPQAAPSPRPGPEPTAEPKPAAAPRPVVAPSKVQPPPRPEPKPEPKTRPTAKPAPPAGSTDRPSLGELEKMPVVKLRQFARTLDNLPIQGREISMANKSQLLDAIGSVLLK